MSDAARRKERKRLKRDKKKMEYRRAMAVSPYKRIGRSGEIQACYINSNWQEGGLASLHVIRVNPQGGFALGVFLIDVWCAGLKNVWGVLDMLHDQIDRHLDRARDRFPLERIEPEAARNLVAGAIRFARQNGFRLPAHYDRWLNFLGDVPDPATADLRPFGKDGGLLWVGSMEDLQRRLIGCSVEEFLRRRGVEFISEDEINDEEAEDGLDDDSEEEEDEDEIDVLGERVEEITKGIYRQAINRCSEKGETPSPLMRPAVIFVMGAMAAHALQDLADEDELAEEAIHLAEKDVPEGLQEIKSAIEQIFRVMPEGPNWANLLPRGSEIRAK